MKKKTVPTPKKIVETLFKYIEDLDVDPAKISTREYVGNIRSDRYGIQFEPYNTTTIYISRVRLEQYLKEHL